jgi:hypothetical protein
MIENKQAAIIALAVLQYQVKKRGMELRPINFNEKMESAAKKLKCDKRDCVDFYTKFLLPSNLEGCGLKTGLQVNSAMNAQEEKLAIAIVMDECFDSTCNIGKTIENIYKNSMVSYEKLASLATFVINERLKREFGKDFVPEQIILN